MTILKTFKISGDPTSAIWQAEVALWDMGCSTTVSHGANCITVSSNETVENTQTGKFEKIGFKFKQCK